ncbi:MAG TPA: DNA mismatch repair protein MutS [Blastocatellia bacterium]|nr:DNA mismatch repair protein MutS [Blastocatellia bacterium]HMZ18515.1 DNA mismatch repair protein MutS [Blastocatellia bacterium]HNG31103.1 DNA mismatch repair protein MutS [Blastocatellia bacterium]
MTTPLRRQYLEIRDRYPGMILMFQIGDFYEAFDEDAQIVARELGVALTRKWFGKGQAHPLAGVPVRSIESHLARLIHRGYKVAICDQVTPPGKGLVEREVTRIVTPGTVIEPGLLEGRANNFLAGLIAGERTAGFAYVDVTTGEFAVTEIDINQVSVELERITPSELLLPASAAPPAIEVRAVTRIEDPLLELPRARQALLDHFGVKTLHAFGCEDKPLAVQAAAAIVIYLRDTQPDALTNLNRLQTYTTQNFMQLDPQTVRNLEVFQGWDFTGGAPTGSLVATIDLTATPMGARKLRRWLRQPLLDLPELRARQNAIEWFFKRRPMREKLGQLLDEILDIERLLGRIRRRLAVPAEIVALAQSLRLVPQIRALLEKAKAPKDFPASLKNCEDIVEFVSRAITDRPPSDFERGNIIRPGFSTELDELRKVLVGGKDFLAKMEVRERARTGIKSLKVSYNKVFGYYIEVTKPNLKLVPSDYIRKQTVTNAERFFTLELKEHESLIANAKERILELETNLYRQTCDEISRHHERIQQVASTIAHVDLCAALAECAERFHYVKPELDESDEITIVKGRHPMIEQRVADSGSETGRSFMPNDTNLSNQSCQIMLMTAPNMAGKSVYLRQVALICLLGQIGSFVPAESARLGLVDRIFTRVGLHDYTLRGHSSFMVEMIETAHILHSATPRSLILLDEVGRGTSTADGLSIARAVVEYLHNNPRLAAKTLFATHYHELTDVEDYLPRVRNFHLAVRERGHEVEYLHKVVPGRAEKSFGIYVAQLAGLPKPVVHRAQELLGEYNGAVGSSTKLLLPAATPSDFTTLIEALAALDINQLTPVEALTKLYELQRQVAAAHKN